MADQADGTAAAATANQATPPAAAPAAPSNAASAVKPAELFDKDQFRQRIPTYALEVPARRCQEYLKAFSKCVDSGRPAQHSQLLLGTVTAATGAYTRASRPPPPGTGTC